ARRGRLILTPRGRALAATLVGVARDVRRATVRGLTPGELVATRGVLRRVLANLERFDPRPGG
ncbi:MAG TPA: hypothetical protein VGU27_07175, partial [Candidatus Eisenbacteria bacterium]|nr:hypothetical protein [Candidatus Eisenbacteria bacterium]